MFFLRAPENRQLVVTHRKRFKRPYGAADEAIVRLFVPGDMRVLIIYAQTKCGLAQRRLRNQSTISKAW